MKREKEYKNWQEEQDEKEQMKKKRNRRFRNTIIIVGLVIILLFLLRSCNSGIKLPEEVEKVVDVIWDTGQKDKEDVETETSEERQERINREAMKGMLTIDLNVTPVFENGKAEGNFQFSNDKDNFYLMQVEVYRDIVKYITGELNEDYNIEVIEVIEKEEVIQEDNKDKPKKDVFYKYYITNNYDKKTGRIFDKGREKIEVYDRETGKLIPIGAVNKTLVDDVFKESEKIVYKTNKNEESFKVVFSDLNGELIYKSGLIKQGNIIEKAKLNVPLPKGDYDCTAYFYAVDPETYTVKGTVGSKMKITILN